jgi:hypothetical protein
MNAPNPFELLADNAGDEAEALNLDQLAAAAGDIDAAASSAEGIAPDGKAPPPPAAIDYTAEAVELTEFLATMFLPLYPRLAGVWTAERRAVVAPRLGAVLAKHGLSLERMLGTWGAEIMLCAAVAPLVLPTIQAVKQDNAEFRAKARQGNQATQTPGAATVAPTPPPPGVPAAPPDPNRFHEQA